MALLQCCFESRGSPDAAALRGHDHPDHLDHPGHPGPTSGRPGADYVELMQLEDETQDGHVERPQSTGLPWGMAR